MTKHLFGHSSISHVGEPKFRKEHGLTERWVKKESASETACASAVSKVIAPTYKEFPYLSKLLFLYLQTN